MGDRLGIIAGSGDFPLFAASEARRMGLDVVVAAVRGEADPGLADREPGASWFDVRDAAGLASFLSGQGVGRVLLAGKIRPEAALGADDANPVTRRILEASGGRSPARIIAGLIRFFEEKGIRVEDPTPFLAPFFCPPGPLTRMSGDPAVAADAEYGFRLARTLADADIGQTVIVKSGMVVAVEGMEGTDRAILRGGELAGPGTVAVKVGRTNQDPRIDLPAVGLETVRSLAAARAAGLAFEAARIPFFRKDEAVALAESRGVALLALPDVRRPS